MKNTFDRIAGEIAELERRLGMYFREESAAELLPARWSLAGGFLCWHVLLGDEILENELDVEITPQALIVRARAAELGTGLMLGVLPVPGGYDFQNPEIRFETSSLEISLRWAEGERR